VLRSIIYHKKQKVLTADFLFVLQLVGVEITYEGAERNLGAKNGKNYTQIIVVNRSVDASYQILVHCPKRFQRRSFLQKYNCLSCMMERAVLFIVDYHCLSRIKELYCLLWIIIVYLVGWSCIVYCGLSLFILCDGAVLFIVDYHCLSCRMELYCLLWTITVYLE
jgi:hypothetical protein